VNGEIGEILTKPRSTTQLNNSTSRHG